MAIAAVSFFIIQSNYAFSVYRKAEKWLAGERHAAYRFEAHSHKLNDSAANYRKKSKALGIQPLQNHQQLESLAAAGKLVKVEGGNYYRVDKLSHSYPYLTPSAAQLLETISSRFSAALKNTDLNGTQLHVTSLLRTRESNKKLGKKNSNASEESAHLRGIAFDISYARYNTSTNWFFRKFFTPVKNYAETRYLKETLAKVLYELKKEGKCWVTYEKKQPCFHIVSKY